VETVFSRSSHALINSTSFMVVAALTWACLDPLIKALFALRCFRGESVRTGLDLRIAIARSRAAAGGRSRSSVKALAAAVLLAAAAAPAIAAPSADPAPPAAVPQASPAELEGLLEKEIADSRYSWRMPEKIEPSDGEANFLVRWIEKAADKGVDGLRWVKRAVERFLKWLDKLFGNKDHGRSGRPDGFTFASIPPFYLLAALLALIVLAIGAGLWRRRPAAPVRSAVAVAAPAPRMPDIASEDVRPDDLPETEWLRLMEELRRKGEHRLAIRALFLAQLSVSARQGWLVVARAKSNRDYQREVALKSRRDPEAADAFRESCLRFDRIWYGQHAVTEEDWAVCLANFGRLGGHGI
jgi:hypothetical protein